MTNNNFLSDKTMIWVLFVILAVLSLVIITGNNAAKTAAKEATKAARTAATAASDAKEATLKNLASREVGNRCLVEVLGSPSTENLQIRYQECLNR